MLSDILGTVMALVAILGTVIDIVFFVHLDIAIVFVVIIGIVILFCQSHQFDKHFLYHHTKRRLFSTILAIIPYKNIVTITL